MIENPESSPEDPGEAMRPPGEEGKREEAGGNEGESGAPTKRIDEDVSGDETEDFDDVESGDL